MTMTLPVSLSVNGTWDITDQIVCIIPKEFCGFDLLTRSSLLKSALMTSPDLTRHFFWNVCIEYLEKVTRYELNVLSRLAMAQGKPEEGADSAPRARNGVWVKW